MIKSMNHKQFYEAKTLLDGGFVIYCGSTNEVLQEI